MVSTSLLFIYMSFLLCLDPLMNQKSKPAGATSTTTASATTAGTGANVSRHATKHQRLVNEEVQLDNPTQECVFSEPVSSNLQSHRQRSSTVLNLVTHEQSKWRKQVPPPRTVTRPCSRAHSFCSSHCQVQQQRQTVYSRHEMLN